MRPTKHKLQPLSHLNVFFFLCVFFFFFFFLFIYLFIFSFLCVCFFLFLFFFDKLCPSEHVASTLMRRCINAMCPLGYIEYFTSSLLCHHFMIASSLAGHTHTHTHTHTYNVSKTWFIHVCIFFKWNCDHIKLVQQR